MHNIGKHSQIYTMYFTIHLTFVEVVASLGGRAVSSPERSKGFVVVVEKDVVVGPKSIAGSIGGIVTSKFQGLY